MDPIIEKLNLLNGPGYEAARGTLQFFYDALSVLDHKAEALMVFDGILIAAAAFAIDRGRLGAVHKWRRALTLIAITLALVAAAACLFVARIKYSFLGDVTIVDGKLQLDPELAALAAALARRTADYEFAWYLSVGAVAMSILVALSIFIVPLRSPEAEQDE